MDQWHWKSFSLWLFLGIMINFNVIFILTKVLSMQISILLVFISIGIVFGSGIGSISTRVSTDKVSFRILISRVKSTWNSSINSFSTFCYTSEFTSKLILAALFISCNPLFFLLLYFYLENLTSHQTPLHFHLYCTRILKTTCDAPFVHWN